MAAGGTRTDGLNQDAPRRRPLKQFLGVPPSSSAARLDALCIGPRRLKPERPVIVDRREGLPASTVAALESAESPHLHVHATATDRDLQLVRGPYVGAFSTFFPDRHLKPCRTTPGTPHPLTSLFLFSHLRLRRLPGNKRSVFLRKQK